MAESPISSPEAPLGRGAVEQSETERLLLQRPLFLLFTFLLVLLYLFGLAFAFYPLTRWCKENEGFSWPWPRVESEKKRIKKAASAAGGPKKAETRRKVNSKKKRPILQRPLFVSKSNPFPDNSDKCRLQHRDDRPRWAMAFRSGEALPHGHTVTDGLKHFISCSHRRRPWHLPLQA